MNDRIGCVCAVIIAVTFEREHLSFRTRNRAISVPFGPPSGIALPEVSAKFGMKSTGCQLDHNDTTTDLKFPLIARGAGDPLSRPPGCSDGQNAH
jgi:hypothetical protein